MIIILASTHQSDEEEEEKKETIETAAILYDEVANKLKDTCKQETILSVWQPDQYTKTLFDNISVTDVTTDMLTITVRECNVDSGFFKSSSDDEKQFIKCNI